MLVLTRKIGQSIIINGNIEIKILPPNSDYPYRTRIGIIAPKEINIRRAELKDKSAELTHEK